MKEELIEAGLNERIEKEIGDYIKNTICGKRVYTTKFNREADLSKISKSEEIREVFFSEEGDSEQ